MIRIVALLALHAVCLYFLWYLWQDKRKAIRRGRVLTKMGFISRRKSPRLFSFSVWLDFIVLLTLYAALIAYSIWLIV